MKLYVSNENIYKIVDVSVIRGKRKLYAKSSLSYKKLMNINNFMINDIMHGGEGTWFTERFSKYKFDIRITFNNEERIENRLKGKPAYKNIYVCGAFVTCVHNSNETDDYDIELCADIVRGDYK